MIYSKRLQAHIPVTVQQLEKTSIPYFGTFTKYMVKDGRIPVGKVNLVDTMTGVKVDFIENMNPQLYSGFGTIADQIEVEHCLNRGLYFFDIKSVAGLNSHALHYLRGKRFEDEKVNDEVKRIIESTPVGQKFDTTKLGPQRMFMPWDMIEKYLEIIKKCPLLKK
ncbi:MAG: hypothetical protein NC408_08085 [Candidatus Gastranaerophilales bacterium]|nr:hypothetical protein [Candidatus Gastranaerophilales bacterium]MCM1073258.1 hypothetical protein [Bacteroides sp.]